MKDFITFNTHKAKVVFSTAEGGKNFNRHTKDGVITLQTLKGEFGVNDVVYLRQVHSNKVLVYSGENINEFIENEGDAVITSKEKIAIGVFTADCVPIILVDDKNGVVAAVHSGWKGTITSIVRETIIKMYNEYHTSPEDIKVFIGPHMRQCCYEISQELKDKFINETKVDEEKLFKNRNLSMEEVILKDLKDLNVKDENITKLNLCTYCCEEVKLHSYRKTQGDYGRLFSFVILN